jgi:hypothetical protein
MNFLTAESINETTLQKLSNLSTTPDQVAKAW